ncbi:alpha/beta hydrolase [Flavobacterium beibuense]|uniref:Putative hydrolase of the alpha/beta superfamily protein n=1 Tax=Flavobacterium beibuense TaxID=657326 RepID=A0A444WD69_9FLAO|nr:alpha/beta hydrolase-fold protein [Flavobacterium beibuense]RYJ43704.1 putative hydrolase of the alpha/beta superfamily protein [Flavobacterium beibuense]
MKKITLLLLVFAFCKVAAQKTTTEEITSEILKENRLVTIKLPPSYERNKDKKYPLLVLLDGDYLFDPFAGVISYTSYWDDLPEVLIVGISQTERDMDCESDPEAGLPFEKGEKFFDFIGQEVIPMIEKKYRVSPFKIIAGHDVTAGFANFFLYKDNPLFNAYIILSPELPTDMETRIPARFSAIDKPIFYYLATADGDVGRLKNKIKVLNDNIKAVANTTFRYQFDEFMGESHYSLVPNAIPSALYHIFSSYQPITSAEFQKLADQPSGYVQYLKDKYEMIERDLGVKMTVRLNDFKAIEAAIFKNSAFEELRDLAEVAKKNYPKTILGEYYEALFYEKTGNIKKAVKIYTNSYNFEEVGGITKDFMLEKAEILKSEM